jgi:hypothetical protein
MNASPERESLKEPKLTHNHRMRRVSRQRHPPASVPLPQRPHLSHAISLRLRQRRQPVLQRDDLGLRVRRDVEHNRVERLGPAGGEGLHESDALGIGGWYIGGVCSAEEPGPVGPGCQYLTGVFGWVVWMRGRGVEDWFRLLAEYGLALCGFLI